MILESYKDCFDVRLKKETYEKLKDIIYFEEDKKGNEQIKKNINDYIERMKESTCVENIEVKNVSNGYYIHYKIDKYKYAIFCYTLTEVIIHLRRLKENWR